MAESLITALSGDFDPTPTPTPTGRPLADAHRGQGRGSRGRGPGDRGGRRRLGGRPDGGSAGERRGGQDGPAARPPKAPNRLRRVTSRSPPPRWIRRPGESVGHAERPSVPPVTLCAWPRGVRVRTGDVVAALRAVDGVADASITPDRRLGGAGTLHLSLMPGADEVAVATAVNRILREHFGLAVDTDNVSVVDETSPIRLSSVPDARRVPAVRSGRLSGSSLRAVRLLGRGPSLHRLASRHRTRR